MTFVSLAKPRKQLPDYLTSSEVEIILALVEKGASKLLFQIQWRADLRVSEALNLNAGDLNLRESQPSLRVVSGKGGKAREVPVHKDLSMALQVYAAMVSKGPLFPKLSRPTAHRHLKTAFDKAQEMNLVGPKRRVSCHTLRHSAARHWLASGVPINVVSRWLGHASLANTLVYLQIVTDPSNLMDTVS